MSIRLSLALETGGFALPDEGRIAVFHPRSDHDLTPLPKGRLVLIQPMRSEYDAFAARGYDCRPELPADMTFCAAVVFLPRSKTQARMNVAQAEAAAKGPVLVDGAKTDGIDSIYKALRKLAASAGQCLLKRSSNALRPTLSAASGASRAGALLDASAAA